jgi:hypothetical protein
VNHYGYRNKALALLEVHVQFVESNLIYGEKNEELPSKRQGNKRYLTG